MSFSTCLDLLGVFGTIGSGKSYFARLVADARGYQYISSDQVFKEHVQVRPDYMAALAAFFDSYGISAIKNDGSYDADAMTKLLFTRGPWYNPWKVLTAFNKVTRPFIVGALNEVILNKPTVLEMAPMVSLPPIWKACSLRFCVETDESPIEQLQRVRARDLQRDGSKSKFIYDYQQHLMAMYHLKCCLTFHCPDYYTILSRESSHFLSDDELLIQFDTVLALHKNRH